jgi:preprotein translocase subunit SecG
LVQQGKGADMGAAFGGGSNTLFGAGGAADFITRLTTGMAIAFMVSSIFLVRAYSSRVSTVAAVNDNPLAGSVVEQMAEVATPQATSVGTAAGTITPIPAVSGEQASPQVEKSAVATDAPKATIAAETKK